MAEDDTQTVEMDTDAEAGQAPEKNAEPSEAQSGEGVLELEATLAARDVRIDELTAELAGARRRTVEVETSLAIQEARVVELETALAQAENAARGVQGKLKESLARQAQAVSLYRASLLEDEPEIPERLVQGDTVEEVQASLAQARQMVEQVRNQMEIAAGNERVPFGAPERTTPDLSSLSPREKIVQGLSRR